MEYFTYKNVKKHQAEKRARERKQEPVLNEEDENFLERIVSAEGTPPPLPQRPSWSGVEAGDSQNKSQMTVHDGRVDDSNDHKHKDKGKGKENKENEKDAKKTSRFSFLNRSGTKKACPILNSLSATSIANHPQNKNLDPAPVVTPNEAEKETDDINRILEDLNLSAVNNRAFSLSNESQKLVQDFTVILKDLVNGVPTAYDDLTKLLDSSHNTLAKNYDHLPGFLQKLITQLPNKLTSNLAPELLAVATEAQAFAGHKGAEAAAASGGGFAGAAKSFLKPNSLKDLVTKPGAVVSMLKAIMNALKLRWPAFMGTNVLLSLGLFGKSTPLTLWNSFKLMMYTVLLFVFWYCHKRGREERLKREGSGQVPVLDSEGRVIELDDDPMLGEAGPSRSRTDREHGDRRERDDLEPRDRRERRGDRERGKHGHSSSHDHGRSPARSHTERRPTSSRRHTSEQGNGRRPKSREPVMADSRRDERR